MKRIIFLALDFPDIEKSPNLYTDLLCEFQKNGNQVFVVAPSINNEKEAHLTEDHGIKILRVPTLKLFGGGLIQKGLSNVMLPFQYKKGLKKLKISLNFDVIIIPTPPITLITVATWIKKRSKAKLYLILRDIFPQNAVDLRMMSKKGLFYRYFRKLETKLYREADEIGCMSPENINYIKTHNPSLDFSKLHLLPNWEEFKLYTEDQNKHKELRKRYNLGNKVIAIYGGNIGLPQQMENIVELAEETQDLKDLVFLIIGWGTEKEKINALAKSKDLSNMLFLENLPRDEYNNILKMADIGLISLNKDFTIPNYPSKVNAYYKFKKPVLASVDNNTDFGIMQENIGCGLWSHSGDLKKLKENLIKLYKDKELRENMGEKGYQYMQNNLTPKNAYKTIINKV